MTTAKRLTKAQKAGLEVSEVKAQAGYHVAVVGTDKADNSDATIKSGILDGIDKAIEKRREEITVQTANLLTAIDNGTAVTITGDRSDGFVAGVPVSGVSILLTAGLAKPNHAMLFGRSLYHLSLTDKGRDWLKSKD